MKRNGNHQGNQHQLSSGPLLTDHLHRQYEHNTPNQYGRQEPTPNIQPFNYSQRYDGSSHFGHYRPQGVKRQAIDPWQMGVPQRHQSPPIPLMGIQTHIGPRSQKPVQPLAKNFQPSKVTKPKPQPAPNKLASYPVQKTKKLVTQAMKAIDRKPDETQILRADRDPTVQVKSRLELALGTVMKQIKQDHCSEPDDLYYFMSNFVQRLLKHTIRTRIRNVMMDQYVGAVSDIVKAYRLKYPKETDIELIKVAKDAQCLNNPQYGPQLIDADDPEEFFRKNMTKVLKTKLDDMFNKLEDIYVNASGNLEDSIEKLPEPTKEKDNEMKQKPKRLTVEEMCGEDGSLTKISENETKLKFYTNLMEEIIEDRLPKILYKYKSLLLSMVFGEKEFLGNKAMITAQLKRKILKTIEKDETYLIHNKKVVSDDKLEEKANEKSTLNEKEEETTPEDNNPSIEITEREPKNTDIDTVSDNSEEKASASIDTDKEQTNSEVNKPSIETTKRPRETHNNEKKEDNGITKEAKENANEVNIQTELGTTPNKSASSAQTPQTPLTKDMLYVKLIGRPVLPARAVICDFLKTFNPASIKKHKSISNLLILGFSDRENFDKILTANESIVGESTIIIKASEQVYKNNQTPGPSKALNTTKTLNENKIQDSSETNDLDSQITDLLISIKKCEEDIGIVVPEALKEANDKSKSDGN